MYADLVFTLKGRDGVSKIKPERVNQMKKTSISHTKVGSRRVGLDARRPCLYPKRGRVVSMI